MTGRQFISLLALFLLFLFAGMPAEAPAQADGADRGMQQFMANCSGCHGADGKGGDKAASIATTLSVMKLSDEELSRIVHDGTAQGMPSFAQIGDANITAVVRYLRTLEAGMLPTNDSAVVVTGDVDAGRALYFGKAQCSNCHMIAGEGGFIASDLTVYGKRRTTDAILKAIVTPDTPLAPTSRVADVRTKTGQKLTGVLRSEDNFSLVLQTAGRPLSLSGEKRPEGSAVHRSLSDAPRLWHAVDAPGTERHCQLPDCHWQRCAIERRATPGERRGST